MSRQPVQLSLFDPPPLGARRPLPGELDRLRVIRLCGVTQKRVGQ